MIECPPKVCIYEQEFGYNPTMRVYAKLGSDTNELYEIARISREKQGLRAHIECAKNQKCVWRSKRYYGQYYYTR